MKKTEKILCRPSPTDSLMQLAFMGRYAKGYYLCIPEWKIGCPLVELQDYLWNCEQLVGPLDAFQVVDLARALVDFSRDTSREE